ncbi:hypothetical protein NT6N_24320 [Oceaniferula spumae]|uniref:Uncharacterized protein n=1 Tax=Oceaniferula spumae TaxID=2979115 RepID=A0AAT9FN51_9BACT
MKTLLTLVTLFCFGTLDTTLAKEPKKGLEQFKSIVTAACKAKGLRVSFRTTHAFGVTTMIPHVHGKLDDGRDSAWEVYQASYPALVEWAQGSGGMGHGTAQSNRQGQAAPAKGTDALHSFRINANDFASLTYQNKTGKGALVMCFIDGTQYISRIEKPNK